MTRTAKVRNTLSTHERIYHNLFRSVIVSWKIVPLRYMLVKAALGGVDISLVVELCRSCNVAGLAHGLAVFALAFLSRRAVPASGKTHVQSPLKVDHSKPGRPREKVLSGPHA